MKEIVLSREQKNILDFQGTELLIKGIPGSGKTTLLLKKAEKLVENDETLKIGVFAFNNTLVKAMKEIVNDVPNIEIQTFHKWAYQTVNDIMDGKLIVQQSKMEKDNVKYAIKHVSSKKSFSENRFVKDLSYFEFVLDEIHWLKGMGIESHSDYQKTSRVGRGTDIRLSSKDRTVIYNVYKRYEKEKLKLNLADWFDLAIILKRNQEKIPESFKYDFVLVDEAQDLDQTQLKVLCSIAKKGILIAADKGQKIYKTYFSWSDIGINIKGGRTKIIRNTYRSTREIMDLANCLQQKDRNVVEDREYFFPGTSDFNGPMPTLIKCDSKKQQTELLLVNLNTLLARYPSKTIGILGERWTEITQLEKALQAGKIKYEKLRNKSGEIYEPGVKLTTYHSAKGLEFDIVLLPSLIKRPNEELDSEEIILNRRLLFVAITRAKEYLQMYTYKEPSLFLGELDPTKFILNDY